ncbi:MAG: dUTP diphosphatase [Halobacteriovoraceae bacterium]|nr:dUTP diphosphatase [Halobacteriovoraceae bacterium]MBC98413.1 dUTP diphosphatase [Halobacteriovoraceae bacterium]|tara:strand:+ start:73441 stop:73914 length:474 start_codon:yes stop_codon:yes gene_type:complete
MSKVDIRIKCLDHYDHELPLPRYETEGAAGADIRASLEQESRDQGLIIEPGARVLVPTGLAMEIPLGYEVQVRPRSGLSLKTSLLVVNAPGTIDSDYRGEVKVILGNFGTERFVVSHGERIAQLVVAPVTQGHFLSTEDELSSTERGAGGFGSTGTK